MRRNKGEEVEEVREDRVNGRGRRREDLFWRETKKAGKREGEEERGRGRKYAEVQESTTAGTRTRPGFSIGKTHGTFSSNA